MLMKEEHTALNNLQNHCQESAEIYLHEAERLGEEGRTEIATVFKQIAERRQNMAKRCESIIRKLREMPKAADPERVVVDEAVEWVKSKLSKDSSGTLLEARIKSETELQELIQAAQDTELEGDVQQWLTESKRRAQQDLEQLQGLSDQ